MSGSNLKDRTEIARNCAEVIAIVVAGVWAYKTFIYKEVTVPESAPINITLDLELARAGADPRNVGLVAVEMKVKAKNPSSRPIHLLPSVWVARGYRMQPIQGVPEDTLRRIATEKMNSAGKAQYVERHAAPDTEVVVATGRLFADDTLQPEEVISQSLIFYVPKAKYDNMQVSVLMPSTRSRSKLQVTWQVDDKWNIAPKLKLKDDAGKWVEVSEHDKRVVTDKTLGFQNQTSRAEVSLWD